MKKYPPGYRDHLKAYCRAMFDAEDWHATRDVLVDLEVYDAVMSVMPPTMIYPTGGGGGGAGDKDSGTASGKYPIGGAYER